MSINVDDVRHLARLSEIGLDDNELANLTTDIENIVGYINQLDELNTDGVEPTFQLTGLSNVWRADVVNNPITRDELLALAPDSEAEQIKVPKVL